jgi:ribosomal protein S18 acetylase RimI-like enzyme
MFEPQWFNFPSVEISSALPTHALSIKEMNIRPATIADLEGMQNANLNNLPENYTLKYYLYHGLSYPHASFVATVPSSNGDERIVGYVLARLDDENSNVVNENLQGHVTSLSVMRTYRRMGIAAKLMVQSLRKLKECYDAKSVTLHVRQSNKPALHLYKETLRFEVIGVEKSYYADGEDAYMMKKNLDEFLLDNKYDDDEDLLTEAVIAKAKEITVS